MGDKQFLTGHFRRWRDSSVLTGDLQPRAIPIRSAQSRRERPAARRQAPPSARHPARLGRTRPQALPLHVDREPPRRTDQHPHREADPRALVQLHHEIDVHEDAQDGQGRQERHLQQDKAAVSAPAGLVGGSWGAPPPPSRRSTRSHVRLRSGRAAVSAWGEWAPVPPPHPNPHAALDPEAPPRTPHTRRQARQAGSGSEPTAQGVAAATPLACSFPGVGRLRFIAKDEPLPHSHNLNYGRPGHLRVSVVTHGPSGRHS